MKTSVSFRTLTCSSVTTPSFINFSEYCCTTGFVFFIMLYMSGWVNIGSSISLCPFRRYETYRERRKKKTRSIINYELITRKLTNKDENPYKIDNHIFVESVPPFCSNVTHVHNRLRIVRIDVKNRSVHYSSHV